MSAAKSGDSVLVHYRGELKDGSIFDQSAENEPLEFTIGSGMLIPDFEGAVLGMNAGESKTVNIEAENAYGTHREDLIINVERTQFPDHIDPQIGQQLQLTQPDGHPLMVKISAVATDSVTLDANHPLAGEDLTFEITLVEVLDK
ncbi:MAG: peptidylprolyl isomerase [Rhodothermales bacterium]